ncbi:MAG: response regulator [Deltaproteobacteria bacterium]|nr:response regulator [Deltaproteobacteria bacterium]
MDPKKTIRVPWKNWDHFTSWAQDFSLKQKVLGGFLGVAVFVGLLTLILGMRLARHTIIEEAQKKVSSDLATAAFIVKSYQENLELKIRMIGGSDRIKESLTRGDFPSIRNRLAMMHLENDLDFLSVLDPEGKLVARAFQLESKGGDLGQNSLVKAALLGKGASGFTITRVDRLVDDNPTLVQRFGSSLPKEGLILEAAYPIMLDSKVIAVIYGGILINNNHLIVERISQRLFKDQAYEGKELGFVAIFQGDLAVSSSLRGRDKLPAVGFRINQSLRDQVTTAGEIVVRPVREFEDDYLTATEPIRDYDGKVVGAIQVGILEKPILSVIDRLVGAFLIIALCGVILMGGISYFLVNWINRPLEQMLNAAKRAAEGDLTLEVPVVSRDEVGELAATFNLMIRNLAESRKKLEEWGTQLASKVAEQTGQLDQAREQVERVKKLASLEKMADGMAHIMAHISDPLIELPAGEEGSLANSRILLVDTDDKVLEICQRILENDGFEVKTTQSVTEALSELEKEIYDVIVTDIEMPEMGGKELLKEIKIRQPEILVMLTASFKATEEAVETVKLGAYDYIPKPFGPHQILLMVYTALQARLMLAKTRREHADQRAETIFQQLPVAIALADDAHRVVYNNRAFLELASKESQEEVHGKSFKDLFGIDPLDKAEESGGSQWLKLEKVGRTAKLYNFSLPEEDLRVLMLLDITETVIKDQQADVFRTETINKAQQVIHEQMRVAQEIAGLLGETTAETKAALFELIKLAGERGATR